MHPTPRSQPSRPALRNLPIAAVLAIVLSAPASAEDGFLADPAAGTVDAVFADGFDVTCRSFNLTVPGNASEGNFNWETGATCTQSPGQPFCPGSGFHFKVNRGGDGMGHELNFGWLNPYSSSNYSACATASYDGRFYCAPLASGTVLNATSQDWREGAGYPFAYDTTRKVVGFKFGPTDTQIRYGYAYMTPATTIGFPITVHYACYGAVGATVIVP